MLGLHSLWSVRLASLNYLTELHKSMAKSLPEFDTLADQFVQQGAFCSPAELHGSLCGQLAAGGRYGSSDEWLQAAVGLMDIGELTDAPLIDGLTAMYEISLEQLTSGEFGFALLLPDDDTPINLRAEALGQWCEGFLAGYAMGGGKTDGGLSDEARETLRDLITISQIATDTDEEESSEGDFTEVFEYVRMSAMLIFAECNGVPMDQGAPPGAKLH